MATESQEYAEAIQRMLAEAMPLVEKVIEPPWAENDAEREMFGASRDETREFALTALSRRLRVIGLVEAAA
jgi:hypothetical protein